MEPNTSLGQHFMMDKDLLVRIVKAAGNLEEKQVLEIGPGTGYLTKFLLKTDCASLTCVEVDERFKPIAQTNWIKGSILDELQELEYDVLISNLPYHICEPLFMQILRHSPPEKIVVVVGEQFAKKLQEQSIIGTIVRSFYFIEFLELIDPQVFSPPPATNSALLRLTKKENPADLFCRAFYHHQKSRVKNYVLTIGREFGTKRQLREKLSGLPQELLDKPLYGLSTEEFLTIHNFIKQKVFINSNA